jgi:hypothetical protein
MHDWLVDGVWKTAAGVVICVTKLCITERATRFPKKNLAVPLAFRLARD